MTQDRDQELAELLKEVRRIEVQSRRLVTGVMAGGYRSVFRGAGIEFEEVREYEPGDDPRIVDWNVTARVGRLHIKKYVDERERTLLFLLDLSPSMSGGFGIWSARQAAARVCACLALSAVRNEDKVGLAAFSRTVERFVPPDRGVSHALRIVRDCLAVPYGQGTDFKPVLDFAAGLFRRRSVLFLVSDFLTLPDQETLARCARRHDLIAVRLLSPELSAPRSGIFRLRDPESGKEAVIDWGSKKARREYEARSLAWKRETEELFGRMGVDRLDISIPMAPDPDALARPILAFFRMRELRGEKR